MWSFKNAIPYFSLVLLPSGFYVHTVRGASSDAGKVSAGFACEITERNVAGQTLKLYSECGQMINGSSYFVHDINHVR
jgi:ribosomal protein L2